MTGDGPNVAFVGLGRMGSRMARNVLEAGFPLTVWNRTASRCDELVAAGAARAGSAAAAAAAADVTISMLADGPVADAVYGAEDGVLAGLEPGSVVIEMSTIGPAFARGLAAQVAARECTFLDAPVSGSVAFAEQRKLTTMVGGERAAFDRVRPVLAAMTREQYHLGDTGTGAAMKLAVNSIIGATNQAVSEALVLAEAAGIDRDSAYEVFADSAIASPFVLYKREAFLRPEETPKAFTCRLLQKDLDLALELAKQVEASMPQNAVANEILSLAIRAGYGELDLNRVADLLRAPGRPPGGTEHE